MSQNSPLRSPTMGRQGTLQVEVGGRNGGSPTSKAARSPTIEEQKSINMAESLNMRAMEADGKAFEESNWYELRPTGSQPQRRGYHAAFVYQDKMYVFGGSDIREGTLNNLWGFDLTEIGDLQDSSTENNVLAWQEVKTHGSVPGQISHHQCIVAGKNMYLVGGTLAGRDYNCSQMYRLDLQTFNWDEVATMASEEEPESLPVCIDEHTAILDGNTVVVFGGFQDGTRKNQVHTFDVETRVWSLLAPSDPRAPAPSARAGHAAVMHEGNLYVFGGKDDDNQKLNDLWRFNLAERVWTQLVVDQEHTIPMARSGHTATLYQGYICIFGGIFEVTKELNDLHLYDIANNRWICLFTERTVNVTAQSPTKSMAMGAASPLPKRASKAGADVSPKNGG